MENLLNDLKNSNEKFSEEYMDLMKQYYEKISKEGGPPLQKQNQVDEEGGIIITPDPNFCIKTKDSKNNKIFINICTHEKIQAPKEEYILEIENQFGIRVPLSLSEKYEDFDTQMETCMVYDVIFNPSVLVKAEKDAQIFQFMIQLIFNRIKQRFDMDLSLNFIRMKNMKYKGKTIRSQRVKVRIGPKIEEIIPKEEKMNYQNNISAKDVSKESNEGKGRTPNWNFVILKQKLNKKMLKMIYSNNLIESKFNLENFIHNHNDDTSDLIYFDGTNANPKYGVSILFLIELNMISQSSGININICDEALLLNCGKLYSLEINLPYKINSSETFSFFESNKRYLYINLPFYEEEVKEFNQNNNKNKETKIKISDDYLYDVLI